MASPIYFFLRFQQFSLWFGLSYLALVVALCTPFFQRHVLYLNAVKLPFFADFESPELYGLAPNKTFNFYIPTADKESIGAWFVFNEGYYQSLPSIPEDVSQHVQPALNSRPTVLFLHGNAATRAFKVRVAIYEAFTARMNVNVLAIDYRGFADSTGSPSEPGLVLDAQAAFDWLLEKGVKSEDIVIVGHSLGTGVGSQLGAQLGNAGIIPRGIVLMSPFSSIRELLSSYHMFGFLPIVKPLFVLPRAAQLVTWALSHKFDSLSAVPNITANVIIAHAENDLEIPDSHSDVLFQAFMEPYLPKATSPGIGQVLSSEEWANMQEVMHERNAIRRDMVHSRVIPRFGRMDEFSAGGRTVTLVKTLVGSHDFIGIQEGLQDIIKHKFRL